MGGLLRDLLRRILRRAVLVVLAMAVCAMPAATAPAAASQGQPATTDELQAHLALATAVQGATRARLEVLGDAFTCPDARFVSFRRSDAEPQFVDQWYVASQLWADAELVAVEALSTSAAFDAQDAWCHIDKGFVFLDRLWDYSGAGYFPRSDPVGANVDTSRRFTDDNLLAGLALLDTASLVSDPFAIRRYTHAAERQADFLMDPATGLWDTTFGGGFWWTTGRGDTPEGKPAQTNALAGLFFSRLYQATNDLRYREWALRSMLWLNTLLYDPVRQLYRWSVSYQDPAHHTGALISPRYFNYDQGIAIEAEIALAQLDGDASRLSRARATGQAMQPAFWSSDHGSYNLEFGIDQVFTSYAAWTSLGDLALYRLDGDLEWLDLARRNAAALEADMREQDSGYALRSYRCVDRLARGCESGQVQHVVDHTRDTAAQAWVQHLRTALARPLLPADAASAD